MSDASPNPTIEHVRDQALARRPEQDGRPPKAARHAQEDGIGAFTLFLEQMKRFPTEHSSNKFSELVEKMAQQPIRQKDIPRILAILHADNLAIFQNISPLPDATKKALLTLVAKLLQLRLHVAKPDEDAKTHLRNSTPYQSLLPVLGWLLEVKTPQLSKKYEEALARALVLFSFDSCEGYSGCAIRELFHDEALPLISATRRLLPAAWNRLAAFPLTQETIIPVIALLALHHREEVWNATPKLPADASALLQNKLKDLEPNSCCTLFAELARVHDIWYFPPVEESLQRDLVNMLLKASGMIPDHSFEMALLGCTAILKHTCSDILFFRQSIQWEFLTNRLEQLVPRLSQMRFSLEGLAGLFGLLRPFDEKWISDKCKAPLLQLLKQFDEEKRFRPSILKEMMFDLLIISKSCGYAFADIQGLFDHIVCQFLSASPNDKEMYEFFKNLDLLNGFKPRPSLSQAIENSVSRWYQNRMSADSAAPPSGLAHDQNPTPEYVHLYCLLALAAFLPADRFQRLTQQFLRYRLKFDVVNPLDRSQTFTILLRELLMTMSQLTCAEETQIDATFTLLRDLLTSSTISP